MASSLLSSLDMSLDDLINSKKKKNPTNPDARVKRPEPRTGTVGPIRKIRQNRMKRTKQPYARNNGQSEDMSMDIDQDFSKHPLDSSSRRTAAASKQHGIPIKRPGKTGIRKGSILSRLGDPEPKSVGTKIFVKNLKFDILEDDVRELFGTVGEVSKAEIVYDRSGRSKGIARVWFKRASDAEKAIKQYDGRTLDGQPMQIILDSETNVREGFFGVALTKPDRDVRFKINLGGRRNGRGGRGGGRGSRNTQHNRSMNVAEDLDNDMDAYMKD